MTKRLPIGVSPALLRTAVIAGSEMRYRTRKRKTTWEESMSLPKIEVEIRPSLGPKVCLPSRCAIPIQILLPRLQRSENSRATATIQLHLAPKCSSRYRKCHKLATNSRSTLELETEEWVSG